MTPTAEVQAMLFCGAPVPLPQPSLPLTRESPDRPAPPRPPRRASSASAWRRRRRGPSPWSRRPALGRLAVQEKSIAASAAKTRLHRRSRRHRQVLLPLQSEPRQCPDLRLRPVRRPAAWVRRHPSQRMIRRDGRSARSPRQRSRETHPGRRGRRETRQGRPPRSPRPRSWRGTPRPAFSGVAQAFYGLQGARQIEGNSLAPRAGYLGQGRPRPTRSQGVRVALIEKSNYKTCFGFPLPGRRP